MPKAYSLDLRERAARFVEAGRSCHAAGAHFSVSVSFVVRLMKSFRATGRLAPKPSGGRRHAKLDPHRGFLIGRVEEKVDMTMPEFAAEQKRIGLRSSCQTPGISRSQLLACQRTHALSICAFLQNRQQGSVICGHPIIAVGA